MSNHKPLICTDGGHVGPIIFADETARQQLLTNGEVVTFRKSQRTVGNTWWRQSRTGEKCGDVVVEEIGQVSPWEYDDRNSTTDKHGLRLEDYAHLSGFDSVEDWRTAIYDLNDGTCEGYLYRVVTSDE